MRTLKMSLLLLAGLTAPTRQAHPKALIWDIGLLRTSVYLYHTMKTEFMGCGYGVFRPDTIYVALMAMQTVDPRTATDSSSGGGGCPAISRFVTQNHGEETVSFLVLLHSHIKGDQNCNPSDVDENTLAESPPVVIMSAIICEGGRTLFFFDRAGDGGELALPNLDDMFRGAP